jgi:hypothetical protein
MSWSDIEDAVHKAVCLASGYTTDQVVWSFQNYNAPELDYVLLTFGGDQAIGQDWIRITQDLTRPAGQEMKLDVRGIREVPLQIEVFTSDVYGNDSARRVAEQIRTKLRLDGIRYGLRRAGLSPFDSDMVQWIPDVPTANFRGRAVVTVRCYVPVMDCYEYVGYIATIRGHIFPSGSMQYSGTSGISMSGYAIGS